MFVDIEVTSVLPNSVGVTQGRIRIDFAGRAAVKKLSPLRFFLFAPLCLIFSYPVSSKVMRHGQLAKRDSLCT